MESGISNLERDFVLLRNIPDSFFGYLKLKHYRYLVLEVKKSGGNCPPFLTSGAKILVSFAAEMDSGSWCIVVTP